MSLKTVSPIAPLTAAHARTKKDRGDKTGPKGHYIEPWTPVCLRCPLADCIHDNRNLDPTRCPINQAKQAGLTPAHALVTLISLASSDSLCADSDNRPT